MRKLLSATLSLAVAVVLAFALFHAGGTQAGGKKGALLCHNVYFSLKDNSPAAADKLVAACKKYLSKHPGEVFFAAGTRAEDLNREVNDQGFDVALHIVFKTRADHDKYQDAARHKQFIDENRANWDSVRVFDSALEAK